MRPGQRRIPKRAIEPFAAYLPPGASLETTTTYPSDPNGWHLVGAQADGKGIAVAVSPNPSPGGWDRIAAETPSVEVGPDGKVSIYYAAHNDGQTAFVIGLMKDFNPKTGTATAVGDPVMVAEQPWEYSTKLGAILEQSVRWMPQLHKYIMYYTAGGWWTNPPDNKVAYAESTDGIHWTNRQKLDFPASYYNQDFLYNKARNRYEMVIAKDPTGVGGGRPRNLVWLDAATPAVKMADWKNEVTCCSMTRRITLRGTTAASCRLRFGMAICRARRTAFMFFSHVYQAGFNVYWAVLLRCGEAVESAERIFSRLGGEIPDNRWESPLFTVAAPGQSYETTNEARSEWVYGPNLPDADGRCERRWAFADAVGHDRPLTVD